MAKKKTTTQEHFDGMEPVVIEELETAALEYVEARDSRMAMLRDEVLLKVVLDEVMKQHDQTRYVCRDQSHVVEITEGERKLKVVKMKADIPVADG